jgi:hypothetical protein
LRFSKAHQKLKSEIKKFRSPGSCVLSQPYPLL